MSDVLDFLPPKPRWQRACEWIEDFCRVPSGRRKGTRPQLSAEEWKRLREIFEEGKPPAELGPHLTAYLILMHLCGPEHLRDVPVSALAVDCWTIWAAARAEEMRAVLIRRGQVIICPELGTSFRAAA